MKIARLLGITVVMAGLASPAWADAKADKIRELLKVLNAGVMASQMGQLVVNQVLPLAQRANPQVPPTAWVVFSQEISTAFNDAGPMILEAMVPVYDNNYTEAEIDDILAFYASPTGHKVATLMPVMFEEGRRAGQAFAPVIAERAVTRATERLRAMGYPLK